MCSLLCPNIIQSTMCFSVTIAFHTSPSMHHYEVVDKSLRKICHYMNGMCKLMHIHTSQWTRTWHIFRFSRSDKREVDVNHNSDYSVIFCHDPVSQIKVNVKSCNAQIDESLLWNMSLSTEYAAALLSFRYASITYKIYIHIQWWRLSLNKH